MYVSTSAILREHRQRNHPHRIRERYQRAMALRERQASRVGLFQSIRAKFQQVTVALGNLNHNQRIQQNPA